MMKSASLDEVLVIIKNNVSIKYNYVSGKPIYCALYIVITYRRMLYPRDILPSALLLAALMQEL